MRGRERVTPAGRRLRAGCPDRPLGLSLGLALGLSLGGCATSEQDGVGRAQRSSQVHPEAGGPGGLSVDSERAGGTPDDRLRVLVTGFNDWRELGDPPELWRCRDNPSCRLLVGPAYTGRPEDYRGPLVGALRDVAPEIDWQFETFPVTWGEFEAFPKHDFDVVVNLGLGIYDRRDTLQVEVGAFNLNTGDDARGQARTGPISEGDPDQLWAPADSPVAARIAAAVSRPAAEFTVRSAEARAENSYICNETHYAALRALSDGGHPNLEAVYFLHLPYAAEDDDDHAKLAGGVAVLISRLVDPDAG